MSFNAASCPFAAWPSWRPAGSGSGNGCGAARIGPEIAIDGRIKEANLASKHAMQPKSALPVWALVFTGAVLTSATAADWAQYRGSATDGQSTEKLTFASYVSSNSLSRAWLVAAETG